MDKIIGKKIKVLRQKYYKTQAAIAKKLGISIPAYSKIESGITDINYSRIKQIADLFQIPAESLLPNEDVDSPRLKTDLNELKARVEELQLEVIRLQTKLIDVYQENEVLKKNL